MGETRGVLLVAAALMLPVSASAQDGNGGVAALGRLEPERGIVRVTAPATPLSLAGSALLQLNVAEGDDVNQGDVLAIADTAPALEAAMRTAEAELALERLAADSASSKADEACVLAEVVRREAERRESLLERSLASQEEVEQSRGEAEAQAASCTAAQSSAQVAKASIVVAEARLSQRRTELERAFVRAPFSGRVLKILAEPGEYVGERGFLELGRVNSMYAIAEVYETDIGRVRIGQAARVMSGALSEDLSGTVRFIRPKVAKQDEIGTDPAARKDARIIEVGIQLDDSDPAAGLVNLQVEILISAE